MTATIYDYGNQRLNIWLKSALATISVYPKIFGSGCARAATVP
jgi:hypothetical protein